MSNNFSFSVTKLSISFDKNKKNLNFFQKNLDFLSSDALNSFFKAFDKPVFDVCFVEIVVLEAFCAIHEDDEFASVNEIQKRLFGGNS